MKAFLLTAGLGSRLRPMTNNIPKCLVPINGKPLLEIWLELCQRHGITEVLINTHYLHEKVEEYFDKNTNFIVSEKNVEVVHAEIDLKTYHSRGLKAVLSYEPKLLGSAGTLIANRKFVEMDKQFLILYGDNLTNTDLGKMVCFHMGHGDLFTMGLFNTNRATACGIAELNQDGKILSFEEKPKYPKTNLAAAGVYVASPEIFELFPPETEHFTVLDLGLHILPKLVGRMYGYRIKEYLLDIGDLDSYYKAQIDWEKSLH